MVLRISLPPMTAWVRSGDISRAVIAMPVRWVTVCGSPGLMTLELDGSSRPRDDESGVREDARPTASWIQSTADHPLGYHSVDWEVSTRRRTARSGQGRWPRDWNTCAPEEEGEEERANATQRGPTWLTRCPLLSTRPVDGNGGYGESEGQEGIQSHPLPGVLGCASGETGLDRVLGSTSTTTTITSITSITSITTILLRLFMK